MSRGVELTWAGGIHDFHLPIEMLRALQERCDAGPQWILARLSSGQWYVDDVVSVVKLGLEGGGLDKSEARKLVKLHVEDRPLTESVLLAKGIMVAALYGSEEDTVGEQRAGTESQTVTRYPEENGVSETFSSGPE